MNSSSGSLAGALTGPILLITLGVLFALQQFTDLSLWQTWPFLLILLGVMGLVKRLTGARS
ncbi:MAG: LiaI-LiaF-like domain-containing protein [Bryobacteraceae bacterium]